MDCPPRLPWRHHANALRFKSTLRPAVRAVSATVALTLAVGVASVMTANSAAADPAPPANNQFVTQNGNMLARVVTRPAPPTKAAALAKWKKSLHAQANQASKQLAIEYLQQPAGSKWCGPTTLADIADYRGMGWSGTAYHKESHAASLIGVSEFGNDGTPWYGSDNVPSYPYSTMYVMEDALNYLIYTNWNNSWYSSIGLPSSPSPSDQQAYEDHLTFDINISFEGEQGMPLAENEYAAPGYGLDKQPTSTWIKHWFAGSGYYNSGAGTYFSDPGWGGGTVSASSSQKVVTALGGRGYVW